MSVLERVESFVSEHKKVLLVGAAVALAAGGAALYYSSSSPAPKKHSKKPRPKKRKEGKDTLDEGGPILEEIPRSEIEQDEETFQGKEDVILGTSTSSH